MSQYLLYYKQINFLGILVSNSIYNEFQNLSVQGPKPLFNKPNSDTLILPGSICEKLISRSLWICFSWLWYHLQNSLKSAFFPFILSKLVSKIAYLHFSNTMLLSNIPFALSRSESSFFPLSLSHKHRIQVPFDYMSK